MTDINNINNFGEYRLGLTWEEVKEYIKVRTGKKRTKRIEKKFNDFFYGSTCAVTSTDQILLYRHDVKRFLDLILEGEPTYWD